MGGTTSDCFNSVPDSWGIERRPDGAVLVRVPSRRDNSAPLPDAVFTFRCGDPQYSFWEQQLALKQNAQPQLTDTIDTTQVDEQS